MPGGARRRSGRRRSNRRSRRPFALRGSPTPARGSSRSSAESGDLARKYDEVAHGESAYFVWLNRGKQSLVLDIKQPDDAALLKRMLKRADVFVQNLAPGAAERAGFGAKALRAENPRLIVCDITGYGDSGPYAEMKAYDFLIQCETGLASITGGPDSPAGSAFPSPTSAAA